jgi:hypothetical protein
MNELDIAKRTWKFFLTAHPEADADGVVETIVSATQEMTLKAVGEQGAELLTKFWNYTDTALRKKIYDFLEALKHGEFPDEK